MRKRMFFIVPAAILGILLVTAIGGEVVRLLWNWLLPPLAGWREITFWQAVGLLVLCRILFGGLRAHGSGRGGLRRRLADRCGSKSSENSEGSHQNRDAGWSFGPSASASPEQ